MGTVKGYRQEPRINVASSSSIILPLPLYLLISQHFRQRLVGNVSRQIRRGVLVTQGVQSHLVRLADLKGLKTFFFFEGCVGGRSVSPSRVQINGIIGIPRVGIDLFSLQQGAFGNGWNFSRGRKVLEVPLQFPSCSSLAKQEFLLGVVVIVVLDKLVKNVRYVEFSVVMVRGVSKFLGHDLVDALDPFHAFLKDGFWVVGFGVSIVIITIVFANHVVVLNAAAFNGKTGPQGGSGRTTDGALAIRVLEIDAAL
mmetsp:Transcript_18325/g.39912  ORF Transcript_18325/g.39912 Transcript_18325/m.39912 type:complete len:254 (-) Transcript_18325:55-816(-)